MSRSRRRRSASEDISDFIVDDDMEEDEPGPSHRHKSQKSHKSKGNSKAKKPREDVEQENEEADDLFDKYREVEYVNKAMSVALSLSHKGVFKESELKPFLNKKNKGNWQDGLRIILDNMEHLFGYNLVHCGLNHCFTVRNKLIAETAVLADLFEGKLDHEQIDDGGAAERRIIQQRTKDEEALLFPVLTIIMMSGRERQDNWSVNSDILNDFLINKLEIAQDVVSKLISGKSPLFVKQEWIRRTISELERTDPVYHYFWGPRAIATVSASKLLEKYCLLNGKPITSVAPLWKKLKEYDYQNGTLQGNSKP